eukprot:COSAG02_NODE_3386_length_6833_cov_57.757945_2_plen_58_part_00
MRRDRRPLLPLQRAAVSRGWEAGSPCPCPGPCPGPGPCPCPWAAGGGLHWSATALLR